MADGIRQDGTEKMGLLRGNLTDTLLKRWACKDRETQEGWPGRQMQEWEGRRWTAMPKTPAKHQQLGSSVKPSRRGFRGSLALRTPVFQTSSIRTLRQDIFVV